MPLWVARCLADCALQPRPQQREHEGGRCVRGAAPRPLEVTEPGHLPSERRLHCVEVWRAFSNSRRPSKHNLSVMSKCRIGVLCPSGLGVGHHRCGRVLSAAEPTNGYGRVDSSLSSQCTVCCVLGCACCCGGGCGCGCVCVRFFLSGTERRSRVYVQNAPMCTFKTPASLRTRAF